MDDKDILWQQYSLNIDLFKHYLKLVVEFNVFFYGITGAVVSYYFAHSAEPYMRYALFLPFAMSVLFSAFFMYGAHLMGALRSEVFAVRDALGLRTAPDVIAYGFPVHICGIDGFGGSGARHHHMVPGRLAIHSSRTASRLDLIQR